MLGQTPFAGLQMTGNSSAFSATTTAAKFDKFASYGAAMPSGTGGTGDFSCKPDLSNNRLLVSHEGYGHAYEVTFNADMTTDTNADVTAEIYVNGAALTSPNTVIKRAVRATASGSPKANLTVTGVFKTDVSLLPSTAIAMSGDPGTNSVTGSPSFAGGSAQPKIGIPVEVYLKSSASAAVTVAEATLMVRRLG